MVNNCCNFVLIGLRHSSTGETPTEGGDPTAAVIIAVVSVIILVAVVIVIILVVACCWKTGDQGEYDTGSSVHVREVYLYIYCVLCLYCECTRWL